MLHGLYWLTANMAAAGPVLVVVDDAHWADGPSLRWLAYLAPRLQGLAAGLLVAVRPAEPAAREDPLLAVRTEAAAVIRPRLLSQAAVTAMVRERAGRPVSEQLCAAVARASGGNPLYVRELARAAPGVSWDRLLFSAKESVYKAWFPLARRWLGFADADVTIDPADGTFEVRLLVPPPESAGLPARLHGRWIARDGLLLTAVTVLA